MLLGFILLIECIYLFSIIIIVIDIFTTFTASHNTYHAIYDAMKTHTFEVRIGSAKLSRVYWSFLGIVKYITTAIEVTTKRLNQDEVKELQRQLQKNLFSHFASQMQEKLMAKDEQTKGMYMRV